MATNWNSSTLFSSTVSEETRPRKRIKIQVMDPGVPRFEDDSRNRIVRHPLGVKPAGNAYTASMNSKINAGCFARLPDELVTHFLELLEAKELGCLGQTCKFLYVLCHCDELWRSLFVKVRYIVMQSVLAFFCLLVNLDPSKNLLLERLMALDLPQSRQQFSRRGIVRKCLLRRTPPTLLLCPHSLASIYPEHSKNQ